MSAPLTTPLTTLLGIRHPIILAGMAHTSTAPLAAAVSAAGGLGVIGGLGYTPEQLRSMIRELKETYAALTSVDSISGGPAALGSRASTSPSSSSTSTTGARSPQAPHNDVPFGVDLALPQVGGSARATNHDYTHGQLADLIAVTVSEGARLFVSAVGVPPASAVAALHAGGVVVMNMVGHPRHARKAFAAGVDVVCAQGGEGGGHTGAIPANILVPACVDVAREFTPELLGGATGLVCAAGGVYDGRGLAAALVSGASGVWVGTRFLASEEAGCSRAHKEAVVSAGYEDTLRTLVVSGRPLRVRRNEYIDGWEKRPEEVRRLTEAGTVPMVKDLEGDDVEVDMPFLMGQVAGIIDDIKPAKAIVDDMINEAITQLSKGASFVNKGSKL